MKSFLLRVSSFFLHEFFRVIVQLSVMWLSFKSENVTSSDSYMHNWHFPFDISVIHHIRTHHLWLKLKKRSYQDPFCLKKAILYWFCKNQQKCPLPVYRKKCKFSSLHQSLNCDSKTQVTQSSWINMIFGIQIAIQILDSA